jgi:hypothetical protein
LFPRVGEVRGAGCLHFQYLIEAVEVSKGKEAREISPLSKAGLLSQEDFRFRRGGPRD